jgi:hypothetical protein
VALGRVRRDTASGWAISHKAVVMRAALTITAAKYAINKLPNNTTAPEEKEVTRHLKVRHWCIKS